MSPMNNRLLVPRQQAAGDPLPLDVEGDAAAAYSLRSLTRAYVGPVVTVERSSDGTQDSFSAAALGAGVVESFCGSGDGYVVLWWDQSGTGAHMPTAGSTHPALVSSGLINIRQGKPAIVFNGTDANLSTTVLATDFLASAYFVAGSDVATYPDAGSARFCNLSFGVPDARMYYGTGTGYNLGRIGARFGGVNAYNLYEHGTDTFVMSTVLTRTSVVVRVNKTQVIALDPAEGADPITYQTVRVGDPNPASFLRGYWQEFLLYHRDTAGGRIALEDAVQDYYIT